MEMLAAGNCVSGWRAGLGKKGSPFGARRRFTRTLHGVKKRNEAGGPYSFSIRLSSTTRRLR